MLKRALLAAVLVACGPWGDRIGRHAQPDAMNAAKYRMFASYFDHIKRKVFDAWQPAEVWRLVDPTGNIYGHANRVTEVGVCLSRDGTLVAVLVTLSSSVPELDNEALRAFSAAAPFARVPAAIVDDLGHVTFTFTFDFQLATRGLHQRRPKT
jgi:TonB family protein